MNVHSSEGEIKIGLVTRADTTSRLALSRIFVHGVFMRTKDAFPCFSLIFDWIILPSKKRGKHCAVFGCNKGYYNDEGLFGGYLFFKFPTTPNKEIAGVISLRGNMEEMALP